MSQIKKANEILESLKAYGVQVLEQRLDYGYAGLPETLLVTVPAAQLLKVLDGQKALLELGQSNSMDWEGLGDA